MESNYQKLTESFGGIISLRSFNSAGRLIVTLECLQGVGPDLGTGDTMVNQTDIYSWR